ncbi:MAG: hypothetical protein H0T17_00245 [Propionibacteriales bacterium]|nr:hypothetical protein [Propionibacteriales bacterium]
MAPKKRARLRLPSVVEDALPVAPGERALAWAVDDEERWYVGTDRALYLPGQPGYRRLGWDQVERADWQRDTGELSLVEVAQWGEPEDRLVVRVSEAGKLLELLRERVTKSVVVSAYAPVRGRLGLSVIGRRPPVGDEPLTWSVVLAQGLRPDDPDVREVAELTLVQTQADMVGL